jgi:hypothetical protein
VALRAQVPSEQESVGALIQRVGTDVSRIVRGEIRLVQLRIAEAARVVKTTAAGLAIAVVLALAGLGALTAGIVLLVASVMPAWVAALAVGGGFLVVALILLFVQVRLLTRGVSEALSPVESLTHEEGRYGG